MTPPLSTHIGDYEKDVPQYFQILSHNEIHLLETKEKKALLVGKEGIYLIRNNVKVGRLKGESNILYIGSGNLRNRLIALFDFLFVKYKNQTKRKHTTKSMLKFFLENTEFQIELLFVILKDKSSSRTVESALIKSYYSCYLEPPPFNHTRC